MNIFAVCVDNRITDNRYGWFSCIAMLALFSLPACSAELQQNVSYPPYPDVWERRIEVDFEEPGFFRAYRTTNGDILSSYTSYSLDQSRGFSSVLFFSGREFTNEAEPGESIGSFEDITLSQRTRIDPNRSVRTATTRTCQRGLGAGIVIENDGGRTISSKSIVLLLAKKKRYESVICEETSLPAFESEVTILNPAGFLELADGTMLIPDMETPTIVRVSKGPDSLSIPDLKSTYLLDTDELRRDVQAFIKQTGGIDWERYFESLGKRLTRDGGSEK